MWKESQNARGVLPYPWKSLFFPPQTFSLQVLANAVPAFLALSAVSEPQNNFYTHLFLCYQLNQAGSRLIWRPRSSSWAFWLLRRSQINRLTINRDFFFFSSTVEKCCSRVIWSAPLIWRLLFIAGLSRKSFLASILLSREGFSGLFLYRCHWAKVFLQMSATELHNSWMGSAHRLHPLKVMQLLPRNQSLAAFG